ncbi:helix-turn-helix domain-containing protein [Pseudonocardia sp. HH130630-07]|uniref:helix-turn-helix domain-containing protein n=1 Tax=Pseudonocardia sp. HH130630-07 TaxID=1690815 RepID=UPI000815130E|nr:helix-turn-helix transcriptional regulator [Pseudonocardia sp. HH130630-07]ANY05016.1 hypothetical protein AFB00_00235 [Pseudonocardia sp. HH130630-07]
MPEDVLIGRRLREIRVWRGLSLRAAAELAGLSKSYLSMIERGERAVERRSTLSALATALRVAPTELTGQPFAPATETDAGARASVEDVREALRRIETDDLDAVDLPDPDRLAARVDAARAASLSCDFETLGAMLPSLATDVTAAARNGSGRARALAVPVLRMTFQLVKDLGFHDVAWMAVGHAHRAALALGDPAWIAMTQFDRARAMIGTNAPGAALRLVRDAADEVEPEGDGAQAYGMLLLSMALQSAINDVVDDVPALLDEADRLATHTGEGTFGDMSFGPRNLGVWRVTLAVETGNLAQVPELATRVDVGSIGSRDRQASFHIDHGRGLTMLRGRESEAVRSLARAEAVAPQFTRANPFAREMVGDLLRRARRDTSGRELRGMAYRMGLAG